MSATTTIRRRAHVSTALLTLAAIGFAWSLLPAFFAAFEPWSGRVAFWLALPVAILALLIAGARRHRDACHASGLAVMALAAAPGVFALGFIVAGLVA